MRNHIGHRHGKAEQSAGKTHRRRRIPLPDQGKFVIRCDVDVNQQKHGYQRNGDRKIGKKQG